MALSEQPPFGRFFLPGPTEVRPELLRAQAQAMIGHRGAGIQALMERLQAGLRDVFQTERRVFVSTSSATGLMEAAVRNGARRRVMALVNGAFSARFGEIARACGFDVETMDVPWGGHHDPEAVRARLAAAAAAGAPFDAVTVVHSETSTGALNDIEAIAAAVREAGGGGSSAGSGAPDGGGAAPTGNDAATGNGATRGEGGARGEGDAPGDDGAVLLVDSVTGAGGAPLHTDAWGLDFVLTGSQKALALPPGLAFGVASERMMARAAGAPRKGVYFDLVEFARALEKLQTPNTPAVSLLYALEAQLASMRAPGGEGILGRWERHRAMAERCWAWVERMREERGIALSVLAREAAHRSPTVTCIELPPGTSGPAVVAAMKARGYVIGGGYGKLKEETIRIGHMGDHTVEETEALLGVLEEVLGEMIVAAAPGTRAS